MHDSGRIKVWDPLVRWFHWTLAGGFFLAYITEDHLLGLHVVTGYSLLGLIVLRLLWGMVGTRHARFSSFIRRPGVVITYLREVIRFRADRHLGHNPAGGAMALALLAGVALIGLSGLLTYGANDFSGPLAGIVGGIGYGIGDLFEETHELLVNLVLLLVGLHLLGVLVASLQHRENLVRAMVDGYKRVPTEPKRGERDV